MNIKKTSLFFPIILIVSVLIGCGNNFICNVLNCKIDSGEDITFFIAADPHHLSKKTFDDGEAFDWFLNSGDGKLLNYTDEIIDAFTLNMKNNSPDILIIPGDLSCNGERESHIELAEKLKDINRLGIHVFVIPGNHDIENPWARNYFGDEMIKIDSIDDEEFVEIYDAFGYGDALSRDNHSLSYLAAPAEDIWLLMLDSSKYGQNRVRNSPEMGGEITTKTLDWIRECSDLAKEEGAQIIAVMHHSLMDHSEIVNENYTIENSQEVMNLFLDCDIQIALTGHIHLQDIKYYERDGKRIHDIATSSLIAYPNQYGVLKFTPGKGFDYSTRRIDMYTDDFHRFSRDFFRRRSYDKYYDMLLEMSKFSDEEMRAISNTVAELNLRYFAGFRNTLLHDILDTEGFHILQDTAPFFIRDYIMGMFDDQRTDNNRLFIPMR